MGCVSAADADVSDTDVISDAVTADVDASTVDDVDVDTPAVADTDDLGYSDDTSDSTGLQDNSDNGDDTVVADDANPKNALKAEPLRADGEEDLTFTQLFAEFARGGTVNLEHDYKWTTGDSRYYQLSGNIVIDGHGHTIDGAGQSSLIYAYRYGSTSSITLKNLKIINCVARNAVGSNYYGTVISSQYRTLNLIVDNCTFINDSNTGTSSSYRGGVFYVAENSVINMTHNVFVNNTVGYQRGSVLYCAGTGTLYANYNVFVNNNCTAYAANDNYRQVNIFFGQIPEYYDINYNWWGSSLWSDYVAMFNNRLPLTPHYYVAKMRQTSATTIELSLNSLQDGTPIPESERLPARPYLLTISPADATIRTPTGNISGIATSNFTVPGNGTITAYIDNQVIVLDIYQNTRGVIALNVTIDNVTLPNKPIAIVNASFDDIYNVTVGEKTYQVTVSGGTGQVELDELPEGTYLAMLSHIDNDEFHDAYNLTTFKVSKASSTITLAANTTTPVFGSDVKVTPTVTPNDATGTIIYTVDGKNYAALEVGQDLIVTGLSAGEHSIVAKYGGNDQYEGSTSLELLINVQKATLTLSLVGDEVVYPEGGKVTLNSNVDGVYTVYIGETPYEARVSLGSGSFAVPTMDVGDYTISINVAESENYTAASATATYKVTKTDPRFSIEGDNRISYGETNTIHPSLNDDARGTITYYIDSATEGTVVSYDGTFTTPATLDAGSHTIRAEYSGDTNYNSDEASFTFTIAQAEADVTVVGDTVIYPNKATIAVTTNAANTYTITVNGQTYTRSIGKDETVEIELETMPIGVYYVSVTAPATTNYKAVDIDKAATVIVNKPTLNLTVYNTTISYGQTANVRITLKDGETGLTMQGLMVAVGGTYYSVDITAGEGTLPLENLNAGTYNVVAICAYDANYDVAYSTGKVTVNKATPTITIVANAIDYGEDAEITVKLDGVNNEKLTGVVKVTVNEKTYDVAVTDGVGTLTISGLAANVEGYPITASYGGNENYEAATYSGDAKQVVNKADATIVVSADATNIKYGESITLSSVVSPADATGVVTYYVDTVEYGTTVSGLSVGTHTVYAKYGGNDNYNEATSEAITITVAKADATVTVSADKTEIKYGETVTLTTGLLPADATGAVTIYVDGGEAGTTLSDLSVGEHTVVAKYAGDDNYTAAESETLTITVAKADVEIVVVPSATTIDYGGSVDLDYTITPATGAESDDVAFIVDGQGIEGTTVSGLSVGEHIIVAQYAGDNNYNGAVSEPVIITVNKLTPTITITGATVTYPNNATVSIEVTAGGQPVSQCTVVVKVNGSSYAAITGNDGKATITAVGLPAGEHAISAETMPNEHYKEAVYTGDAKVVVSKGNTAITVSVPSDGLVVGHEIVFSSEITPADATGYVIYLVDDVLVEGNSMIFNTPGDHSVVAKYVGNDNYTGAESDPLAFTIAKADPTVTIVPNATQINYGESVQLTVTVSPELPLTNVVILVDDNPVEGFVLDDLSAGDHTVVAKYVGDDEYNEAESNPITITVKKVTPTITVTGVTVTYPADATVSVKVTYDGAPLEGINANVKIGQNTYALVTDANGEGSVTIGGLSAGEYPLTAQTIENDNYTNASYSGDAKIVVEKADITVTSADATATYPETGKVTITASVAGVYTVHVGDETVIANVESDGGSATVEIPKMDANTDGYDISVTAPATNNHNAVDTGAINKYIVNKGTVHVHADDVTVVYPNTKDMIITASAAGNYSIMIGRWVWDITIETDGGSATVNPGKQFPQRYEVFVRSNETKNYNAIEDFTPIANYTIIHADVSIEVIPNATNIIAGESISLNYLITPETGAESDDVSYLVDGQAIEGDTLSNLAIGTHTIVAYYAGSEAYNPATSAPVIITVGKLSTEIEGQDITVYATVGKTVEFTLKDSNGNILAGKTLTVAFNGETKNITTDENGVAKLDINMANKGTYSISASFAGDDSYESSYAAFNVVVKAKATKLTVSDTSFSLSGSKYVTAKLTAGGEPLANKIVTFSLNGKTYTGRTNSDGVVKVAVALTAKKTYSVVVSFNGDTTYGSAVATYKLKVTS